MNRAYGPVARIRPNVILPSDLQNYGYSRIQPFKKKKRAKNRLKGLVQMNRLTSDLEASSRNVAAPTICSTSGIRSSFFISNMAIDGLQA